MISDQLGIFLAIGTPSTYELGLLGAVVIAGFIAGTIPGYKSYKLSLSDGLTIRI